MPNKKSYAEDLAEWVKKKKSPKQNKPLVAFMMVKNDVEEAIQAGYALKTIWEHMHENGKIPYQYNTFLQHVKKHIKEKNGHKIVSTQAKTPTEQVKDKKEAKAYKSAEGFQFDSKPNKEELI